MNKRTPYNIVLAGGLLMACCGPRGAGLETTVASSLDVLAEVVGPASKAARSSCDALEELALARVRAGELKAVEAEASMAATRKRCDQIRENINTLRVAHEQAVERYEAGELREAMERVEEAKQLFRFLSTEVEPKK